MSRTVVLDFNVLVSVALRPAGDSARILERVLLRQTPQRPPPGQSGSTQRQPLHYIVNDVN